MSVTSRVTVALVAGLGFGVLAERSGSVALSRGAVRTTHPDTGGERPHARR